MTERETNSESKLRMTPLAKEHELRGARMVDYAGWWMPVQYRGLKEEHLSCRSGIGLFDVSHMGEIRVSGKASLETVQWLTTNDASKLAAGEAQYSLFPNENGGIVDDLIVYCLKPGEDYLLCVNAANVEKDFDFVVKHNRGADIRNESARWGQIAIQGPKALKLLDQVFIESSPASEKAYVKPSEMKPFQHQMFLWKSGSGERGAGCEVILARTGYTGELGAEVFVPAEAAVALWKEFLEKGAEFGAEPIGLGARDTLRTEMKYSLYGHEIDDTTNPYEAGLGWVIKPQAKDFVGKEKIAADKLAAQQKLVGFELTERGIPRQGYALLSPKGERIGQCTSGTLSPSLGVSIGIGFVKADYATPDSVIAVDIRGKAVKAIVRPTPFVETSLTVKK